MKILWEIILFILAATCQPLIKSIALGEYVHSSNLSFSLGETARLHCLLLPEVKQVNWTNENIGLIAENFQILPKSERYQIEQNATRNWTLVIKNVQFSDSGIYTCSCSSEKYTYKQEISLNVVAATMKTTREISLDTSPTVTPSSSASATITTLTVSMFTMKSERASPGPQTEQAASGRNHVGFCPPVLLLLLLTLSLLTP